MPEVTCSPYVGQHCESTMLVNLLRHRKIPLSEPMVFGLGQGFNFIYWHAKNMAFPFIGGRVKPDLLTANLSAALGLNFDLRETKSAARAWEAVTKAVAEGNLIGLKLDHYHLDYFADKTFHFCAHYLTLYGYDEQKALVIDTVSSGGLNVASLENLAAARSATGPMSSGNLSVILEGGPALDALAARLPDALREAAPKAIAENARAFLNPPIKNMGWKGVQHAGREVPGWLQSLPDAGTVLPLIAKLMERGGTGGGLFRKLYANFLKEAHDLTGAPRLSAAAAHCLELAEVWTTVSELIEEAGRRGEQAGLIRAGKLLTSLADHEKALFESLADANANAGAKQHHLGGAA